MMGNVCILVDANGRETEEDESKIGEKVLVEMSHRTHVRRKTKADNGQWQVCPPAV